MTEGKMVGWHHRLNRLEFQQTLGDSEGQGILASYSPWVCSLGWEDPLEKEMVTHASIPAWRIPRTEDLGGLQSMGLQRVGRN